ncbi:MAG: hypothetical protein Q8K58_05145 [Acidimicrobiales bacterium]|nr:hypothetical protein [Acidimicrobiales bacterium]
MPVSATVTAADLRAAPQRAADARTGRFELVVRYAGSGALAEVRTVGAYDHDEDRTEQLTTFGGAIEALPEWQAAVTPEFEEGIGMRTDGAAVYLKIPMLAEVLGSSGWVASTDGADRVQGLASAAVPDGLGFLDVLLAVEDDVEPLGRARVRDAATTRLRATVDLGAADGHPRPPELDLGVVPLEAWIDDDGLVRRLVLDAGDGAAATLELYDYGAPLDIEIPPLGTGTALDEPPPEADG